MNRQRLATMLIAGLLISNPALSQDHWETAIFAGDSWNYIIPSQEPSSDWNSINFDDKTTFYLLSAVMANNQIILL